MPLTDNYQEGNKTVSTHETSAEAPPLETAGTRAYSLQSILACFVLFIIGRTPSSNVKKRVYKTKMKPYGRKTRKLVENILMENNRTDALSKLADIPDEQLIGHLFSHFYHKNDLIKFRSITAMGLLAGRLEKVNIEKARIVLRRIMWNLNDESGGIGWGSPEAMGEILFNSPKLAEEFKSILFSYLDPDQNYLEHPMLQRGVLWGIGTYLEAYPLDLETKTEGLLFGYLHSEDAVKKAYAIRALANAGRFDCSLVPESILTDENIVQMYHKWHFHPSRLSDIALACTDEKLFA